MGFEIREGVARTMWAPMAGSSIPFAQAKTSNRLYVGQLVTGRAGGVLPLTPALGWADKTHRVQTVAYARTAVVASMGNNILGVVVGTNMKTPNFSATYAAEYIDYLSPASATSETYVGVGGPWAAGEKRAMVKIALIDSTTVLRAPLFSSSAASRTAPSVLTVTTAAGSTGCTTATCGFTPVAGLSTVYFRSGGNAAVYRGTSDASATAATWVEATPVAVAAGDTIVRVALPMIGKGRMQTNNTCMWINAIDAISTDYFAVDVLRLDLSTAGNEYVDFRFDPSHFLYADQTT